MRGFRPQNDANGGAVPFGARGLNELRSLIPQMESMGYKQAQPQVQQPQDNRGAAGLKAIIPQMEAMGYKQQPQQYFADGGFVQGVKRAFGMDEERNAQIAAYRARAAAEKAQQQAQAQQQTPQPQQRAVTQYSGMSATQRREKELGLADGGSVRPRGFVSGKGTATSDSIPARLSNGEYVLPADTVRAVGVEALDALRESTHKPVKGERAHAARGFFAGGTPGGVGTWFQDQEREQEQRKQEALAAGQAAESAAQAGAYAPGVTQSSPGASELYMQDRTNEMKDQWGQGKYAQAAGTAARTVVQGLGMHGLEAADKLSTPVIDAARDFGRGLLGSDTNTAKPATQPEAPAQNPTDARLAAGTQTSPMSGAMNQPKPQPKPQPDAQGDTAATTAREVVPGVYNHGRGQYSDDPNGMNMPKGFTGQPSAANNAILERMSDQSKAESMARLGFGPQAQYAAEVQRAKNINADEAARNNSVAARMQRLADPFTAEGRAMRNLQMNIDSSLDRNGRPTADTAALLAQSKAMSDGYLAEPNQQRTIDAGLQREGMQQDGATMRTSMQEQGANSRAADSNAIAQNEFNLKKEAAGFQTRAAAQRENLRNTLIDPKATPEQRKQAQEYLQALAVSDKEPSPQYKSYVMPAIRNADGSTTEGGVYQENTRTGEGRWVKPQGDGQAQQGALPKVATPQDLAALKSGTKFVDANGVERIKK